MRIVRQGEIGRKARTYERGCKRACWGHESSGEPKLGQAQHLQGVWGLCPQRLSSPRRPQGGIRGSRGTAPENLYL
ncbi:hypothetical protein KDH_75660 [Dictyobacter sp. S3.2.2.5]|uniref:Uncharacterized protein n=1 Tax=Dictyobacter halimunensis TaxID=3026934 RepID=A0ABQ6G634_9CHLR|nr:hypothetical protein KDH_75660 [Dictyobacter sp. S3.2.2.5]